MPASTLPNDDASKNPPQGGVSALHQQFHRITDQKRIDRNDCSSAHGLHLFAQGPGSFHLRLNYLSSYTRYSVHVVPEIVFEGRIYRGAAYRTEFRTADGKGQL